MSEEICKIIHQEIWLWLLCREAADLEHQKRVTAMAGMLAEYEQEIADRDEDQKHDPTSSSAQQAAEFRRVFEQLRRLKSSR